jgi:glucose/arabinose dehydrogenase
MRNHGALKLSASAAVLGLGVATLDAATPLDTVRVLSGLSAPLYVTHSPTSPSHIYILQQGSGGTAAIRVATVPGYALQAAPFLSISGITTGGERGLLGLAFHPNYASNKYFYVNLTGAGGHTNIRRYTAISDTAADPASMVSILTVTQPFSNHNGGWLEFGPDGKLYIGMGDGGSAGDPANRAQNPAELLGKILRIDVDGDDFPADPGANYAIPPDNPLVGVAGARGEIWHLGVRNPWRNAFDRQTGDLYIADVGQNIWEEVNVQPAHTIGSLPGQSGYQGGKNYGWKCYEGDAAFVPALCADPNLLTFPVYDYSHSPGGHCSVTGGYVYRGCAIPSLQGTYFFADYCSARIWSFVWTGVKDPPITDRTAELAPGGGFSIASITSFGEDWYGEMYIVDQNGGEVFKIVPSCPGDLNGDGKTTQEDLGTLLADYLLGDAGDLDCDGTTGQSDLGTILAAYGCGV